MIARCGQCGQEFEFGTWGEQVCPHCGTRVLLQAPVAAAAVASEAAGGPLPWERREELGLVTAYLQSAGRLLAAPQKAFSGVHRLGGDAFLFAVITWGLIGVLSSVMTLVAGPGMAALMQGLTGETLPLAGPVLALAALFVVPVLGLMQMSVWALLVHLGALVTGANRRGLEGTFTAVAYGQTPNLLSAVPLVGWFAQFWAVGLVVYGVKRVQDTSTGKALVAVLWPVVLGLICGVAIAMMIGYAAVNGAN